MLQFLLALLAGLVTIGGPCILPLLPIVLGTSVAGRHPLRPFAIVFGFILTFTAFAVLFSVFGSFLGLSPNLVRSLSTAIIGLFGVMMLFPTLQAAVFARLEPVIAKVMPRTDPTKPGLSSGFLLGLTLGAVWTPCAGPVLGTILTLIAAKQNLVQATALLLAFAIGAGLPMLLIAYGGQYAVQKVRSLSRYTSAIQRVFGVIVIAVAVGIGTGYDTKVQAYLFEHYPQLFLGQNLEFGLMPPSSSSSTTAPLPPSAAPLKEGGQSDLPVLADHMPPFVGITRWWNTPGGQPLTPEKLKGRVVLVDFWTYSCINCIRTQPVLRAWWKAYADQGLVIVGVHTPEFAFEKDPNNVGAAIKKDGLEFPIALDPDYGTWNAYANQYWPAEYFFDKQGRLRHTHFGEGEYDQSEQVIRDLLAEGSGPVRGAPTGADSSPKFDLIQTPETYFGYARASSFANADELQRDRVTAYSLRTPSTDEWSIGGNWLIDAEKAVAQSVGNVFQMNVSANAMHVVLGSTDGLNGPAKRVRVLIDGANPSDQNLTSDAIRQPDGSVLIKIDHKDLYRVARFPQGGRHTVELKVLDAGVEFYATTFGE